MATEICTDYACAERVALALVPLPGLTVILGGVGDDWLRAPAYPYAVVAPSEAEAVRGSTTRTIRVRLAVRGADAASKPAPVPTGIYNDWTFAAGLLAAAQTNLGELFPALATGSRLEVAGPSEGVYTVWLVEAGHTAGDMEHGVDFAAAELAAGGLSLLMKSSMPWALEVVPVGSAVATRTARTMLRVGAGPALDALVQAAREALSAAQLGAPLESIATSYDPEPQYPVQSAELLVALEDPQAYGDAF